MDERTKADLDAAWFSLGRDFTFTGPHDRVTAHAIVAEHRPHIEAALRASLATADKPLTGKDGLDIDTLWEAIAASLTVAETHKTAIYRGEGVQPADALSGIEKHIAAGLAARVMYERLRTATTEEPDGRL